MTRPRLADADQADAQQAGATAPGWHAVAAAHEMGAARARSHAQGDAPRLQMHGVTRRFGRHQVLRGIDLEVAHGEHLVLAGPNGAGKTTLLRIAAGLLRPTHGSVSSNGHAPTEPAGRRGMSFLSQDAPVYAELSVREHIAWWTRVQGRALDRAGVDGWLDSAGLRRLAQQRAHVLSRGQRQRLGIVMALAPRPTLLLLDEPTTALDAAGRRWLQELVAQTDAAVVVASHDAWPASRILRLEAGRWTGGRETERWAGGGGGETETRAGGGGGETEPRAGRGGGETERSEGRGEGEGA